MITFLVNLFLFYIVVSMSLSLHKSAQNNRKIKRDIVTLKNKVKQ